MNDRQLARQHAQDWLKLDPLYLDTETTGLGPADEICQIAVLDAAGGVLISQLVRPTIPIPADASRIHGITDADVTGAPTFAELWPQLREVLHMRHVVIYNANYDVRMMRQSGKLLIPARLAINPLCAMELFAQFYGEWNHRHRSYRWQSLGFAGAHCGINQGSAHQAISDAEACRKIVMHMAAQEE